MTGSTRGDAQGGGGPIPPAALRIAPPSTSAPASNRTAGTAGRCGQRACAAAIAGLDADVIGLQEVRLFPERGLARRLPGYAGAAAGRAPTAAAAASAAPSATVPPVCGSRTGPCAGSPTRRGCRPRGRGATPSRGSSLSAASQTCGPARHSGLANLHWDGACAVSRLRGAEALLGWLDPALPWLVVGDLNATARDPAVEHLVAGGLADTLAGLGPRGPLAATHHAWDGSTDGTRIDYVLAGPHWEVLDAFIDHTRPGGRLPSDHWPVVADVVLEEA